MQHTEDIVWNTVAELRVVLWPTTMFPTDLRSRGGRSSYWGRSIFLLGEVDAFSMRLG
jgi:hypothetical protein